MEGFSDNESKDIQDYTSAYGGKIDQIQQRTANPVAKPAYDESLQAGVTSSLLAENQQFSSQSTPGDAATSPRALQYLKTAGVNPISKTQAQAQTGKTVARVGGKFTQTEYIDQVLVTTAKVRLLPHLTTQVSALPNPAYPPRSLRVKWLLARPLLGSADRREH